MQKARIQLLKIILKKNILRTTVQVGNKTLFEAWKAPNESLPYHIPAPFPLGVTALLICL